MTSMQPVKIDRTIEEIITLYAATVMAITITPFAIYRFFNGQHLVAMIEQGTVIGMALMTFYMWKTRHTKTMMPLISAFVLSSLVLLNYLLSTSVLFWIYPVIMMVYFLASTGFAISLSSIAIIALIPLLIEEKAAVEIPSIIATLCICQVFGFLVSRKIRQQYVVMENIANQDGLTGALNRRAFEERLNFLYNLAARHKTNNDTVASLILFDIDDFKKINDKYGHIEGDNILIGMVELFKSNLRNVDQLYRYGGEEFAIIANGSDALMATELAEKLRKLLEFSTISAQTDITASFGVSELQRNEKPLRWIERTDKAMYRAKRAGKNRVYIANYSATHDDANKKQKINKNH